MASVARARIRILVLATLALVFIHGPSPARDAGTGPTEAAAAEGGPAEAGAARPDREAGSAGYPPGEILVKFRPRLDAGRRERVRASLGAERRRRFRGGAEHWRLGPHLTTENAMARLRRDPDVLYVEPNYFMQAQRLPNDPRFTELWGLLNYGQTGGIPAADIDVEFAWDITTGSRDVRVGVIDSGIDYTHPDLAANIYINSDEIPGNGMDDDQNGFVDDVRGWDFMQNDNDPMDELGHGTHVAGTIGAVGDNVVGVSGVAWQVTLVPLRFIGPFGQGTVADAVEAIDYATRAGLDIINASWGGLGFSQTLFESIEEATEAGILFVTSAGNRGVDADLEPHYPSSFDIPGIVAVAATNDSDSLPPFSNYGALQVDLAAPGVAILSTVPSGGYALLSGTSMATPHVAGAAALLRSVAPRMPVVALKQKILGSVDPIPALADKTLSGGRLDVLRTFSDREADPPGACAELDLTSPQSFSLTLEWTATGDDGGSGTASLYDVRYSTVPFDESGFAAAIRVKGPPSPLAAGSRQSIVVGGLASRTTYYFSIKAIDDWGNAGPMSALANGTTLDPPDIDVHPQSLGVDLFTDEIAARPLTILNTGAGPLTFDLAVRASPGSPGSGATWLSVEPVFGAVPIGGSLDVMATFNAARLAGGDYDAEVVIASNDPDETEVVVSTRMRVTGLPEVGLLRTSVDFGELMVGATRSLPFTIVNLGTELLTASLSTDHPDFSVGTADLAIPANQERQVAVTFRPSLPTILQGTLTLITNDRDEGTLTVPLRGTGLPGPDIALPTSGMSADLSVGRTTDLTMTLRNTGSHVLNFATSTRLSAPPMGLPPTQTPDARVLIVQVVPPGHTPSEVVLAANGLVYDTIEPARLPSTELRAYQLVIVPGYQTPAYYSVLAAQAHLLSAYVAAGGVLQVHAAGVIGDASLALLPGGTRIHQSFAAITFVLKSHPLTAGVETVIYEGSRAYFDQIPAGADHLARDGAGQTTLLVYRFGGGTVIAGGQPFENGGYPGIIMNNMVRFGHGLGPRWLQVDPPSGVVPAGAGMDITVTLDSAGVIGGEYGADISVTSNDPDEPEIVVPVQMRVAGFPEVAAPREPLEVGRLRTARAATRQIAIQNPGLFDLTFEAVPAYRHASDAAGSPSLADVLADLNAGHQAVTSVIPNRFDFSEGDTGDRIIDGGDDMYDGGNRLHTSNGGPLAYSDNTLTPSGLFGAGGRYFTRKYPGLFVLGADLDGIDSFSIEGMVNLLDIGAMDGAIMEVRLSGVTYRGLVKRVFNTAGPSVNHLIILADSPTALHELPAGSAEDHHIATGLGMTRRLYYLLYAGRDGTYIGDAATLTIMKAFLSTLRLAPPWLTISPGRGTVPPGGSAMLTVTFDAAGLGGGGYEADLVVISNDPDEPEVVIPVRLGVMRGGIPRPRPETPEPRRPERQAGCPDR